MRGGLPHGDAKLRVLLFAPNVLGYCRVGVLALAAALPSRPVLVYCLFLANFIADGVDGVLARRMGQVSQFGAFLDVTIDVLARGYLWSTCAQPPLSFFVVFLEMLTFACTHASSNSSWKEDYFRSAPGWVQGVMAAGFKQPAGVAAVYGLMGLPLWLYARRHLPGSVVASWPVGAAAVAGRLLAGAVELWVCCAHVRTLLSRDALALQAAAGAGEAVLTPRPKP